MNIKKILFFLLFMIFVAICLAQDIIKLKTYVGKLKTVDVFIEGVKYNFLFDSGGGETFICPEIAKRLDKEIYGSSTGFRMDGEMIKYQKADSIAIKIGTSEKFHQTIGVWDIMSILPEGLPKLDGVLSLKSFASDILTIDLSRNILIIEDKSSYKKRIKTKMLLPSRFAKGPDGSELNLFIGIPKSGHMYWFLFDTGNIGSIILSDECATIWGLRSSTKDSNMALTNFEFILGKNKFKANPDSKNIIYDGSLNFETICKYIFTIDLRRKEVWIN